MCVACVYGGGRGRMGNVRRREPPRKVAVEMTCGHPVWFYVKLKPKSGEPLWCYKCADYKEAA